MTEDGLIRTNITDRQTEFLSESIGLYLLFLVEQERKEEFAEQVNVLSTYFLDKSNLIAWRIEDKDGKMERSTVNAWIDDARIVHALYEGSDAFGEPAYAELADAIARPLTTIATKDGLPVDFVDMNTNEAGNVITLSYLDEAALRWMGPSSSLYTNSRNLLAEAPLSGPFFAKSYDMSTSTYAFDEEINLIDQAYVALRYEQFGLPTDSFYAFFQNQFDDGPVYGRYDRQTATKTVEYESQAVYALAVFYLLERGEREFATRVMDRLQTLAVSDTSSKYIGGQIDIMTNETHAFDNLLPLLAEGGLLDGYLVP
ncbi:hypothetical protein [Exiguobacterium sp. SL-9]|uniref:hypothetical protein n=1 Tax=Exiguobacterium sp. SL-9 TaxID=2510963 RepID=UPI00103A050E|nr:hypothetical protein [Exiguobacterium sp. SL-9]TCI22610.1 hypothetical protein EVJ34_08340 [Exiguobacterium sp. SL-9]